MENFLTIHKRQVNKFDCLNIDDIDQARIAIVILWQEIIRRGSQPREINADMEDGQFESNSSGHHGIARVSKATNRRD